MNPNAPAAEVVMGDMLAAGCDDLGIPLGSREVRLLATHLLELLALAGWELVPVHRDTDTHLEDQ